MNKCLVMCFISYFSVDVHIMCKMYIFCIDVTSIGYYNMCILPIYACI